MCCYRSIFFDFDNDSATNNEYFLNMFPDLRDDTYVINAERKTWNAILKGFVDEVKIEEKIAKRMKLSKSVFEQLKCMRATNIDQNFAHACRALTIATAIVLTSESCERSFSTLSVVKILLRSTMTDQRLAALKVGYYESDVVKRLKLEDMLALFSSKGNCRINI